MLSQTSLILTSDDEVLAQGLLRDIRQLSGVDGYVFQHYGTPAHRSRHTGACWKANVAESIEPENWPPNSPDLNPVDYSIWGVFSNWSSANRYAKLII